MTNGHDNYNQLEDNKANMEIEIMNHWDRFHMLCVSIMNDKIDSKIHYINVDNENLLSSMKNEVESLFVKYERGDYIITIRDIRTLMHISNYCMMLAMKNIIEAENIEAKSIVENGSCPHCRKSFYQ